jgi:hypothetical protein
MTCHRMFITRYQPKHSNTKDTVSLYWNVLDVVEAQAAWIAEASGPKWACEILLTRR